MSATETELFTSYKNLIEDFLEEKEILLEKLEANGTHPLRTKALKSEIRRCKRVLEGKRYDRRNQKQINCKEVTINENNT